MLVLRRLLGLALLATAFVPLHRLLDPRTAGPAGAATRGAAEASWTLGLAGSIIVVALSWLIVRMWPVGIPNWVHTAAAALLKTAAAAVLTPSAGRFALLLGVATLAATSASAVFLHGASPTSVDGMAQMLHAQSVAAGRATIPLAGNPAFWVAQNGIVTPEGWASIYPPLHTLLLALGVLLGAPWVVGPVATTVATVAGTAGVERLCGAATGRLTGILLLLSPFWLLLGSTHLSHTTAAAGLALVLFSATAAQNGALRWTVLTGASVGVAVCARPWIGLACSATIVSIVWWPRARAWTTGETFRRCSALVFGGAPFAALLFWWNQVLFGHPLRLGYTVAFGPSHGLGLHRDPWGNDYGLLEAVGYTGADLSQLGVRLLESPLPLTVLVAVLLWTKVVPRGAPTIIGWAATAVIANSLYWHHGSKFGPRMLFESVPAWMALLALACVAAFSRTDARTFTRLIRWTIVVTLIGGLSFAPFVLAGARSPGIEPPPNVDGGRALVLVHGSWSSRTANRLVATGMRRDSIETALRRNDACTVHQYAQWRSGPMDTPSPALNLQPLPGFASELEPRALSPGNVVRIDPSRVPDLSCAREAASDRFGVLELELLSWQAPPLPERDIVFARDLGPAENLSLLMSTTRTPWIYLDAGPDRGMMLLPYDDGIELLWRGAAGALPR